MIEAGLAVADRRSSGVALHVTVRTEGGGIRAAAAAGVGSRADEGGRRRGRRGAGGEKRRHPDETEIGSKIYHPEAIYYSHNIGDEDDEDPRPANWPRLPPTDNALTLPNEPAPVTNNDHYPSRTSRSPSVIVESAIFAEYQEWPFQGSLKRTKIGNKTIYNLEFQLPHIPEHLHSEAFGMHSNNETSTEAATPHDAGAPSKMHPAAVRPRIKRVRWIPEEDATILKMRGEDGCLWEEIAKALSHQTPGAIQVQFSTKLEK